MKAAGIISANGVKREQTFLTPDFLLQTNAAKRLYHDYAAGLPVIDYHNHLPPQEIATDKRFTNLTEIWLKGDHYKWRAMRTLGVEEEKITGDASDEEKFHTWARCVPQTVRNPLFHWTHMELKNPFGVNAYLDSETAGEIYAHCNECLRQEGFSARALLQHFNAEMVCTTDDPCDDLSHHKQLAEEGFGIKMLPGFRPDKALNIQNKEAFLVYIQKLEACSGIRIVDFASLLQALQQRVNYFSDAGCCVSDHGLITMPSITTLSVEAEKEFRHFLADKNAGAFSSPESFAGAVLLELCKMYHAKGWVQQFHLGAMRNNNARMLQHLGPDSGFDSIGDDQQARALSLFLNQLDKTNQLAKTILYNLNPAYNEVFAAMTGNFSGGGTRGKIQFGSGWWFLDQLDGMEKQLNALSSIGLVSTFVGMLTDSRSFLSFPRHEYFRRLLCNLFGAEMEKGLLPNDEEWIGKVVKDICYYNAKKYFSL